MSALDKWVGQTIQFEIEDGATTWPKVYSAVKVHPDAHPQHMLAIPSAMVPADLLPFLKVNGRFHTVSISSRKAPLVSTPSGRDEDLDHLVQMLLRLDAQNRPRDDIFHGRRITVTAEVVRFESDRPGEAQGPLTRLILTCVTVHI